MSSMSPVRNPQCPPSHWWWQGASWHTSNHARMLKFCTQVGYQISNNYKVKYDPCPPCLWSGTLNVLQVTDDDKVLLDTLLIRLECRNLAHRSWIQCQELFWGQGRPMSSMSWVRNNQCPPSHWWWWGGSWYTSNHARKLKFGTQIEKHIWRTFIMSKKTHVLHVSWQEPSKSSKSLMMTGGSWHTSNHARDSNFCTHVWRHLWSKIILSMGRRPTKALRI